MTKISIALVNALAYAADAHNGQPRKGTDIPYICHPMAVSSLVLEFGGDEDLAVAGMLHDVIEDCDPVYEKEMQANFGSRVYAIVRKLTDGVKDENGEKRDWKERKTEHIASLEGANPDVLLVAACDKLHNARSILADVRYQGLAAFDKFRGGVDGTLWYLYEMARLAECTAAGPALLAVVDDISSAVSFIRATADSEGGDVE